MNVPFLDLKAQYVQIKDEVHAAMNKVMETSAFVLGEAVKNFEEAFAAHHGAKYCVATSCGTSALHVALLAMGVGPEDEVIVPVNTFIATAEAVSHCGAKPVFVDMDEKDYCIDPQKIARAVTPRTKVVIPVHLYGQPTEMDRILAVAADHGLKVLEDCAQAHDAEYKGRKVGTFGAAGAFSFYPGKNLGAYGEGGAVLTNDGAMAAKIRMLRDHGSAKKYYHDMVGYNYRMHGFQGAVLGVKLKYLVAWTDARRKIAKRYEQLLSADSLLVKPAKPHVRHVYHLFVVQVKHRDRAIEKLKDKGVATGIHYPIPLHLTEAYGDLGYKKGDFPVAEAAADELLSLPMYPELTDEMTDYVAMSLKEAL
ncbi:MAG: DegT/DnrJ/EryC1/StrS family aminotransferase [Phycisphaerae bacterium]|jgi:dTDP-4-amino-4,6-dideoxygalactose transaminase